MLEPTHDVWDFQEADSTYSLVETPLPFVPPASERRERHRKGKEC